MSELSESVKEALQSKFVSSFEYITQEKLTHWHENGSHQVKKEFVASNHQLRTSILAELCWAVATGCVAVEDAVELLVELKSVCSFDASVLESLFWSGEKEEALSALVIDAIWICNLRTAGSSMEQSRLGSFVRTCIAKSVFQRRFAYARLDANLLSEAKLCDARALRNRMIRLNTVDLFVQNKFNIFRECPDGFAELAATLLLDPASAAAAAPLPNENQKATSTAAHVARVQRIIGVYQLCPNRTLDMILQRLIAQCAQAKESHLSSLIEAVQGTLPLLALFERQRIVDLVAFHLHGYAPRESSRVTAKESLASQYPTVPEGVYRCIVALLHEQVISLSDLDAFFWPDPEKARARMQVRMKNSVARAKRVSRVLLNDSSAQSGAEGEAKITEPGAPNEADCEDAEALLANQWANLAAAMIKSGESWSHIEPLLHRLGMAARPLVVGTFPQVAKALLRRLARFIHKAYAKFRIKHYGTHGLRDRQKTRMTEGVSQFEENMKKKKSTEAKDEPRMKDQEESEAVPMDMHEASNVPAKAEYQWFDEESILILMRLGPYLGEDGDLYLKVARLCMVELMAAKEEARVDVNHSVYQITRIVGKCLLPGLSLGAFDGSPTVLGVLWDVMRLLPYAERYRWYARLRDVHYQRYPQLLLASAKAVKKTKATFRRLSKDNAKEYGRKLAKISHTNAIPLFDYVLSQIQAYDNIIPPAIASFIYTSRLGFDQLSYLILCHLTNPERSRLKGDGLHSAHWLHSIGLFCGKLYGAYSDIEIGGLLRIICATLQSGSSLDLIVLDHLIAELTNVELIENISDDQLEASSGGASLQHLAHPQIVEAASNHSDRNRALEFSTKRLLGALDREDLLVPLWLLMAKQRDCVPFNTSSEHLKLIANLYDQCHHSFSLYGRFMHQHVKPMMLKDRMPSLCDLVLSHGLRPASAFHILRPLLRHLYSDALLGGKASSEKGKLEGKESKEKEEESSSVSEDDTLEKAVCKMLPASVWNLLTPTLYAAFWSLSLYDISIPTAVYDKEHERLQKKLSDLVCAQKVTSTGVVELASGTPTDGDIKKARDAARSVVLDKEKQKKRVSRVKKLLSAQGENFFPIHKQGDDLRSQVSVFLLRCVHPRCLQSAADAVFAARFVFLLHRMEVKGFSLPKFLDCALREIPVLLRASTEMEASCIGRYVFEILSMVDRWLKSSHFQVECAQRITFISGNRQEEEKILSFDQFVKAALTWYSNLAHAWIGSLQSGDYLRQRNTLTVLILVVSVFPRKVKVGKKLAAEVLKICNGKREDLKVLAKRYQALLDRRLRTLQGGNDDDPSHHQAHTSSAMDTGSDRKKSSNYSSAGKESSGKHDHYSNVSTSSSRSRRGSSRSSAESHVSTSSSSSKKKSGESSHNVKDRSQSSRASRSGGSSGNNNNNNNLSSSRSSGDMNRMHTSRGGSGSSSTSTTLHDNSHGRGESEGKSTRTLTINKDSSRSSANTRSSQSGNRSSTMDHPRNNSKSSNSSRSRSDILGKRSHDKKSDSDHSSKRSRGDNSSGSSEKSSSKSKSTSNVKHSSRDGRRSGGGNSNSGGGRSRHRSTSRNRSRN